MNINLKNSFPGFLDKVAGSRYLFVSIIAVFISFSARLAVVKRPWDDNIEHINIAYNLLNHGTLACTMLPEKVLPRYYKYDKYVYAMPPGVYLLLAPWFKLFGAGFVQLRIFSILFGLMALISWILLFRKMGMKDRKLLTLILILLSVNFVFISSIIFRPFESVMNTLLPLGLFAYLHWREKNLKIAIFLSQAITAFSGIVHPNGLLVWLEINFLILWLDRKKLRWHHTLYYLSPYIAFGMPIVFYIFQDFEAFKIQFLGSAIGNETLLNLIRSIPSTIRVIFPSVYGWDKNLPLMAKGLLFLPLFYAAALLVPFIKLRHNDSVKLILILVIIHTLFFMFINPHKAFYYAIYFVPLFSVMATLTWDYFRERSGMMKNLFYLALVLVVLANLSVNIYRIRKHEYRDEFLPEMSAIKGLMRDGDKVYGSLELGAELGMDNVMGDCTFGYYSKEERELMITGGDGISHNPSVIPHLGIRSFVEEKIKNSDLVYEGKIYKVYRNKKRRHTKT